jgi:mRNA interferase MazF
LPDDDAEYYPFEVVIAAASPSAVLADQVKSLDWRKRRAKHKGKISFAIVDKGASVLSAALNLFP